MVCSYLFFSRYSVSLFSMPIGFRSLFVVETTRLKVQCHQCGKEVDIVTAGPDSLDHMTDQSEVDRPEIVQPPAGFADSPNGIMKPRLYKKVDKRFRSEERHGDRRHHRNRSESRAKSEERGTKDEQTMGGSSGIRPAGSSPCVGVEEVQVRDKFGQQVADPEQGIYHGLYRLGVWICIANQDVFKRGDLEPGEYFSNCYNRWVKAQTVINSPLLFRPPLRVERASRINGFGEGFPEEVPGSDTPPRPPEVLY